MLAYITKVLCKTTEKRVRNSIQELYENKGIRFDLPGTNVPALLPGTCLEIPNTPSESLLHHHILHFSLTYLKLPLVGDAFFSFSSPFSEETAAIHCP